MVKTVTFRSSTSKIKALDKMAAREQRDRSFLLNAAVDNLLELDQHHRAMIEQGLRDDAACRHVSHEAIVAEFRNGACAEFKQAGLLKLIWTTTAQSALRLQREFIARDDPAAAGRQFAAILRSASLLLTFPAMGRIGRVAGTRELPVAGTPFVLAYRVSRQSVRILTLLHGRQQWPTSL